MRVLGGEPARQADIFNLRFYLHRCWGESKIRRGNGLTLWGEELFLSRHCSVGIVFSFWREWSDSRALGGRDGCAAQDLPHAIAHSGQAGNAHALLSQMDSRRARADRSDHGFDRPEIYRDRKDAEMEARSARRFYFSRGSSRGRERSRREPRLRFTRII